jgi:hypothetical protein
MLKMYLPFQLKRLVFRPEKPTFRPKKPTFQLKMYFQCPFALLEFGLRSLLQCRLIVKRLSHKNVVVKTAGTESNGQSPLNASGVGASKLPTV